MSHPQDIHPFSQQFDSEEYTALINELNNQVAEHHPEDLVQFCATFFLKKLEDERAESRQYDQHPLGNIITNTHIYILLLVADGFHKLPIAA
jgi:hypothetical protein